MGPHMGGSSDSVHVHEFWIWRKWVWRKDLRERKLIHHGSTTDLGEIKPTLTILDETHTDNHQEKPTARTTKKKKKKKTTTNLANNHATTPI